MNRAFLAIGVIFVVLLLPLAFGATLISSPGLDFNTTEDSLRVNWTNSYSDFITIGVDGSVSSMTLGIANSSNTINRSYNQKIGSLDSNVCGALPSDFISNIIVRNSTPYDISSATYNNINISTQDTLPTDIIFNNDGTKMYEVGAVNSKIYEYDLSDAFNISSAVYNNVNINTQNTIPTDMIFNNNGTKMYELGISGGAKIYEYDLSDAFNISSAVYNNVNINTQDTDSHGLTFNDNGRKLYEIGSGGDLIYEYDLSDAFNISSATYNNINISTQDSNPQGLTFNDDGRKLYEIGATNDLVYEYDIGANENSTTISGNDTHGIELDFSNIIQCPAGRYEGLINITNSSDTSEFTNTTILLDIPIAVNNTLNETTGAGTFDGEIPGNATEYQSFYFNTSEISDASSVLINLTWVNQTAEDIDMFLFDSSGNLKARSINNEAAEELYYGYLPSNEMWEIRLFGNSTSEINYTDGGNIYISTLNATNTSDTSQQYSLINIGDVDTGTKTEINTTLMNNGTINYTSITESFEFYQEEIETDPTLGNISFRVPDFATKISAELNWTGSANYTIKLFHPNGTEIDSSTNKHVSANVTQAEHKEFVEFDPSSTVGFDDDGEWLVNITRHSGSGNYTLITKRFFNATDFIESSFNATDGLNETDSHEFSFNLTLVNNKSLTGTHKGNLIYTTDKGSILKIPLEANITNEELFVNNTFNKSTVEFHKVTNENKNVVFNISVENTGNENMTVESVTDSGFLNLTSTEYITLSYNNITTKVITPGSSEQLTVTLGIDPAKTSDKNGTYTGWILLNDTDALPYSTFNLSIEVVLHKGLDVFVRDIKSSDGDNDIDPSVANNVTLHVEAFYNNGTEINDSYFDLVNFTNIHLVDVNTSYRIPSSGGFDINETLNTSALYDGGVFKINATIPANSSQLGGYYNFSVTAEDKNGGGDSINGTALNGTLIIENEALRFDSVSDPSSLKENEEGTINLTVVNYGSKSVTGAKFNISIDGNLKSLEYLSTVGDCTGVSETDEEQIVFTLAANKKCYFAWNVTGKTKGTGDYDLKATSGVWYGNKSFSISVKTESSSTSSSSSSSEAADKEHSLKYNVFPTTTEIVQGNTKTIKVEIENNGDYEEKDLEFSITGIDGSWYKEISKFTLTKNTKKSLDVEFIIPSNAKVKSYTIKYKIKNADITKEASSTLKVTPSNATVTNLGNDIESTSSEIDSLVKEIESAEINATAKTEADENIESMKSKLEAARKALADEDYFTAASLLGEIEDLIKETKSLAGIVDETKSSTSIGKVVLIILGVAGGIGIIGLIVYMLMPPSPPGVIAAKPAKPSTTEMVKNTFTTKKKNFKPKKNSDFIR